MTLVKPIDSNDSGCYIQFQDIPPRPTVNEDKKYEATVWIANEAGHPYHKVRDLLGEGVDIKPLSLGDINPLRVDRLSWHLARGIARYVSDEDYLLISGSPVVNALALTMWLQTYPECKLILWDAKVREYLIATVERDNLAMILQQHMER